MQELIIRDVRLQGSKPKGDKDCVLEVDKDTPISWPILWTQNRSDDFGGDVYLRIMAHGFEPVESTECFSFDVTQFDSATVCHEVHSQGGGGIVFCAENIVLKTLYKFAPLYGKLKGIDLLACGAAYITPGLEGREGDGNVLCSRLAKITHTWVRASTATQEYDYPGTINFGKWEGTVLTYNEEGAVVRVEHGANAPASCPVRPPK